MGILDGFLFWLGKTLAEVALVFGTLLTIGVVYAIVLIVCDISRKRKLKK